MTQLELQPVVAKHVKASPEKLHERMLRLLEIRGDWTTRRQMAHDYAMTDRECRLARQYDPTSIVMGQGGYKAASRATVDELAACANQLISQGKEMIRQGVKLRRAAHERIA